MKQICLMSSFQIEKERAVGVKQILKSFQVSNLHGKTYAFQRICSSFKKRSSSVGPI